MNSSTLSTSTELKRVNRVALREADEAALERLSREGLLSLDAAEMKAIQEHFRNEGRDPTDGELETIAQTWSEHCNHKTFKARYAYEERQLDGETPLATQGPRHFDNLLKETIAKATHDLSPAWCLSVFKDNAGVIEFDQDTAVSFKVETHNHPSALEPYGGAGTGLGGVIRDVLGCGLGGKPVLNTDIFCFGPLDTENKKLPEGALHPKRIAKGVVSGVRDYGNRMGIPTANGAIYFDPGYRGNPLVFCGTVGYMPKTAVEKSVQPEDLVVTVGGRTGRDGIHGATFSSASLEKGITSSVVQIGHAIVEKKVLDVMLQARDKGLYRSVTDCGAGGFSSAIGELGTETGVRVHLEKAPLKYPGLRPWEIWVSESQERMVLAVPPEKWTALKAMFDQENVEATEIGEFTSDGRLTVMYEQDVIVNLDMHFLHDGVPRRHLKAVWDAKEHQRKHVTPCESFNLTARETLRALLAHPVIASKETVIRQYDHEVQGGSIVKPLMGAQHDGPTDACVFRPNLKSWRGVALSNGMNPEIGKWDPYLMAKMAIDEAMRNIVVVGGNLSHVAILDNFCWGDSKDPSELAALVRASEGCREAALVYQTPFISGKDSFNNTWRDVDGQLHSIPCTLVVSAIGILEDVRRCITSGIKADNSLLYLIGPASHGAMKGSLAAQLWGVQTGPLPAIDLESAKAIYKRLQTAMKKDLILSAHDVSEGGVAVAAVEMAFGASCGVEMVVPVQHENPSEFLFNEAPSRIVVEVSPSRKAEFEQMFEPSTFHYLGKTMKKPLFTVKKNEKTLFEERVETLKALWKNTLKAL